MLALVLQNQQSGRSMGLSANSEISHCAGYPCLRSVQGIALEHQDVLYSMQLTQNLLILSNTDCVELILWTMNREQFWPSGHLAQKAEPSFSGEKLLS